MYQSYDCIFVSDSQKLCLIHFVFFCISRLLQSLLGHFSCIYGQGNVEVLTAKLNHHQEEQNKLGFRTSIVSLELDDDLSFTDLKHIFVTRAYMLSRTECLLAREKNQFCSKVRYLAHSMLLLSMLYRHELSVYSNTDV